MRHPFVLAAVVSLATLAVPSAAHALDWNFSFSFNNGDTASGTMTTGGTSAVAGQTYSISAISGTFKGESITGLDSNTLRPISNQFEWTGGSPSFKVYSGIGWTTPTYTALIRQGSTSVTSFGYPSAWELMSPAGLNANALTSFSISPVSSSPAAAPGPLPLLGAGAAFSMSRRLRRRISRADLSGVAGSLPSRG
jgi:hypothetical protein